MAPSLVSLLRRATLAFLVVLLGACEPGQENGEEILKLAYLPSEEDTE